MVNLSATENPLKEAGLQFIASLAMVFSFIEVYHVKHETPFLNFIPEKPIVLVVVFFVVLEVVAISALIYSQL